MGWRERLSKTMDKLYEPENTPPPEMEVQPQIQDAPLLVLEQTEGLSGSSDIDSSAKQLLEEELASVISVSDEDTIFRVEACLQFVGEFAPPETVCMMLKNVAGKDPSALAEDGRLRISTIEQFIEKIASQAKNVLQETSDEAETIKKERIALSSTYVDSCETAHRNYDEKMRKLQEELDEELKSLKEQNDADMADIEERSRQNAQMREDAQNLSRAVEAQGRSMIDKISKLLALITTSDKPDSN